MRHSVLKYIFVQIFLLHFISNVFSRQKEPNRRWFKLQIPRFKILQYLSYYWWLVGEIKTYVPTKWEAIKKKKRYICPLPLPTLQSIFSFLVGVCIFREVWLPSLVSSLHGVSNADTTEVLLLWEEKHVPNSDCVLQLLLKWDCGLPSPYNPAVLFPCVLPLCPLRLPGEV